MRINDDTDDGATCALLDEPKDLLPEEYLIEHEQRLAHLKTHVQIEERQRKCIWRQLRDEHRKLLSGEPFRPGKIQDDPQTVMVLKENRVHDYRIIGSFRNPTQAARRLGIARQTIMRSIQERGTLYGGLAFTYCRDFRVPRPNGLCRKVRRLGDGKEFNCLSDVIRQRSGDGGGDPTDKYGGLGPREFHRRFMRLSRAVTDRVAFQGERYVEIAPARRSPKGVA